MSQRKENLLEVRKRLVKARGNLVQAAELYDQELGSGREIQILEHRNVAVKKDGEVKLSAKTLKITIKDTKDSYKKMHEQLAKEDSNHLELPMWMVTQDARQKQAGTQSSDIRQLPLWMAVDGVNPSISDDEKETVEMQDKATQTSRRLSMTDRWCLTWLATQKRILQNDQHELIKEAFFMDPNYRQPVMRKIDRMEKDAFVIDKLIDKLNGEKREREMLKASTLVSGYKELKHLSPSEFRYFTHAPPQSCPTSPTRA